MSIDISHKKLGNTSIIGSEIDKLYFLNIYYWYIYHAIEDPEIVENHPVPKLKDLSNFHQKRLQYIFSISKHGTIKSTDIVLSPDANEITTILHAYNSKALSEISSHANQHLSLLESLYMRVFIPEFDCDSKKYTIAQAALDLKNNLIVDNSKFYLENLFKTYQICPGDTLYMICFYYSLIIHSFLSATHCDFFTNFEALSPLSDLTTEELNFKKLEEHLLDFYNTLLVENNSYDLAISSHNLTCMVKFSSLLLDLNTPPQTLYVHIFFSKNNFSTQMLKKNLIDVFGSDNISLVDTSKEADVILSDFYQPGMAKDKFYYFDDPYNHNSWDQALSFIIGKAYKKKSMLNKIKHYNTE